MRFGGTNDRRRYFWVDDSCGIRLISSRLLPAALAPSRATAALALFVEDDDIAISPGNGLSGSSTNTTSPGSRVHFGLFEGLAVAKVSAHQVDQVLDRGFFLIRRYDAHVCRVCRAVQISDFADALRLRVLAG